MAPLGIVLVFTYSFSGSNFQRACVVPQTEWKVFTSIVVFEHFAKFSTTVVDQKIWAQKAWQTLSWSAAAILTSSGIHINWAIIGSSIRMA